MKWLLTDNDREEITIDYLKRLHRHCDRRIMNGDLDLDGWVYDTRENTEKLLKLLRS